MKFNDKLFVRRNMAYSFSSGLGELWALSLGGDFNDPSDM